jgi:EpsI family protein
MLLRAAALFICLAAASGAIARAERSEQVPPRLPFAQFPAQMGEWRKGQELAIDAEVLAILGVDDYLSRTYFTPDRSGVGLYVGYYESQKQGDTIHSPLNCLPGAGWEPLSNSVIQVPIAGPPGTPAQIGVNRYIIQKGLDRQLVLYWYQAHGRVVASEYWGKFYLIADAVRLNRTDAALVRVISPIIGDQGEQQAETIGVRFVQTLFPALTNFLPL